MDGINDCMLLQELDEYEAVFRKFDRDMPTSEIAGICGRLW